MVLCRAQASRLRQLHLAAYLRRMDQVRPLPGARELLQRLSELGVPWGIRTSGSRRTAAPAIEMLTAAPPVVVTRDDVARAKPDPDLVVEAARRLGVDVADPVVV